MWRVRRQVKLRTLWRRCDWATDGPIYVVKTDSQDTIEDTEEEPNQMLSEARLRDLVLFVLPTSKMYPMSTFMERAAVYVTEGGSLGCGCSLLFIPCPQPQPYHYHNNSNRNNSSSNNSNRNKASDSSVPTFLCASPVCKMDPSG